MSPEVGKLLMPVETPSDPVPPTRAQAAAVEHTAPSVTPEEETRAQFPAVVGSHCTVLGYNEAEVGTGIGVGKAPVTATEPVTDTEPEMGWVARGVGKPVGEISRRPEESSCKEP